jgi:DNA-binding transcriptional LysR family regulator
MEGLTDWGLDGPMPTPVRRFWNGDGSMLHGRLLRYIDEVARRGSIRKAAAHLNIASTAINRQIIGYEEEIGTRIFDRLPRSVRPTAAGEILLRHIRNTLREHDRVRADIAGLASMNGGRVVIATHDNLATNLMPRVTEVFRAKYPRVQIRIMTVLGSEFPNLFLDQNIDLALGYNLEEVRGVEILHRYATRLGAIMAPSHPLAGRSSVRLADCSNYTLVIGDESMTIHGIIRNAFNQAGMIYRPQIESNSVNYMKNLAKDQDVITFMSAVDVVDEGRRGELVWIPIYDHCVPWQTLALVQSPNGGVRPAASRFAEEIHVLLDSLLAAADSEQAPKRKAMTASRNGVA